MIAMAENRFVEVHRKRTKRRSPSDPKGVGAGEVIRLKF
jgi:hypothetical protein